MAEIIVDIGDNLVETIGCEYSGELVRCKDCKHCKRKKGTFRGEPIFFYRCAEHSRDVESDDYCSWGEREGE
jgi:hypothetical protein